MKIREIPWSEQKNPCRHLEQLSLEDALARDEALATGVGALVDFVVVLVTFASTGFSVVCFPVLHLDS